MFRTIGPFVHRNLFTGLVRIACNHEIAYTNRRNVFQKIRFLTTETPLSKVLILGSGGLPIGQPSSLDAFGVQAIHAIKQEGIKTVLMNPNIAAMQTDNGLADTVYFVPITPDYVERVVQREKPDSVLFTFGGQTALRCGLETANRGIFEKYQVRIIGTPLKSLLETVNRDTLLRRLNEIHIPLAESSLVDSIDKGLEAARKIGYPVVVRQINTMGTWGSEFAHQEASLRGILERAFLIDPVWIIEKSMEHWKSIEVELLRDGANNCLPVCHMESFDPIGIHPGNSIMVAPSQTLTPKQTQSIEEAATSIVHHLGIRGACNVHFAVEPDSERFRVISVNPRVSRTTSLATRASGLVCSYVAAKISLNETKDVLSKLKETFSQHRRDYLVCRVPRFDLNKFHLAKRELGSAVKSVGEATAVGRTFAEALQKAIRMVNPGFRGFDSHTFGNVQGELRNPTDQRLFAVVHALTSRCYTPEQVHAYTGIDMWFLKRLFTLGTIENRLREHEMKTVPEELLMKAKRAGFSDRQLAEFLDVEEIDIRRLRIGLSIVPTLVESNLTSITNDPSTKSSVTTSSNPVSFKDATIGFLYATYHGNRDEGRPPLKPMTSSERPIMILGGGVHRIGSSVEYDWSTWNCIKTLQKLGHSTLIINYNPELALKHEVLHSHRLYFEELTLERILDIGELETPSGIIISMGGQVPLDMAMDLDRHGMNLLGTKAEYIDIIENRMRFYEKLDELGIAQPPWRHVQQIDEATEFASDLGYPVLVRPSYVLAGTAFNLATNRNELERYFVYALEASAGLPVVLTQFIENAREIDVDGVAENGNLIVHAVIEKIENAGIHSGDSTLVLPSKELSPSLLEDIRSLTERLIKGLQLTGPFNIQIAYREDYGFLVMGCNPRASRSFPFTSKALDVNFIDLATKITCGHHVQPSDPMKHIYPYECVKIPQFSFARVAGADPFLNVDMTSTSEVACFGEDRYDAYLEGIQALYGFQLRGKTVLLGSDEKTNSAELLEIVQRFHQLGFTIYGDSRIISVVSDATSTIHLRNWEKELLLVVSPSSDTKEPSLLPHTTIDHPDSSSTTNGSDDTGTGIGGERMTKSLALRSGVDLVVSLGRIRSLSYQDLNYVLRRQAIDFGIPLIYDSKCALLFIKSLEKTIGLSSSSSIKPSIRSWKDYVLQAKAQQ